MPLVIEGDGTVEIAPETHAALHGRIVFTGQGAHVAIGFGCVDTGLRIEAGSNATIRIGARNHLGALFIHACPGAHIELGDDIGINGLVRLLAHEPTTITIGTGCLLAAEVDITTSDMHPIFDTCTNRRLNPPRDVLIAPKVWIGQRSLILKGVTIGQGAIIGAGSVVTRPVPPACIAAGNPARITRHGVRWAMDL